MKLGVHDEYKVTERILNISINYANKVKGPHKTQWSCFSWETLFAPEICQCCFSHHPASLCKRCAVFVGAEDMIITVTYWRKNHLTYESCCMLGRLDPKGLWKQNHWGLVGQDCSCGYCPSCQSWRSTKALNALLPFLVFAQLVMDGQRSKLTAVWASRLC